VGLFAFCLLFAWGCCGFATMSILLNSEQDRNYEKQIQALEAEVKGLKNQKDVLDKKGVGRSRTIMASTGQTQDPLFFLHPVDGLLPAQTSLCNLVKEYYDAYPEKPKEEVVRRSKVLCLFVCLLFICVCLFVCLFVLFVCLFVSVVLIYVVFRSCCFLLCLFVCLLLLFVVCCTVICCLLSLCSPFPYPFLLLVCRGN